MAAAAAMEAGHFPGGDDAGIWSAISVGRWMRGATGRSNGYMQVFGLNTTLLGNVVPNIPSFVRPKRWRHGDAEKKSDGSL